MKVAFAPGYRAKSFVSTEAQPTIVLILVVKREGPWIYGVQGPGSCGSR